jgi:hypothetical protein
MDSLARLAGALSLLASFRMGPWRRIRDKLGRGASRSSSQRERRAERRPQRSAPGWADALIGVLWAALLLFMLGYLALHGEAVIAELDGLVLATPYSMQP